jgi:hypothetical protein
VGAAQTTLGDVEVSVWAERQPARIVQAGRENRDNRPVLMPRSQVAGGCLGTSRETQETGERDGEQRR